MCYDGEIELNWNLKCDLCNKKPACNLRDPQTGEPDLGYGALCEKCGVVTFGVDVVSDWAGTDLYLAKYPNQVKVWK